MKKLTYSRDALKTLGRMPADTARLIRSILEQYVAEPASLTNNVKAIKGQQDYLRLRIGDWRVIFSDNGEVIAVIKIAPRGGAYS
ncbi:type II toxin-antitoxin system RelE family toxin [Desulfurivibrio dismutans]|uniref:type II toxin-antitoxin system RelE family toxin n=1 Tax=Desulfurivibrio dismutans TaxID=1398908 RepID=UPI0023DA14F6|nr:type II toxin-antitoxin system RelE/ParE family toxin [Desulfurivibrio alkaliphilus]MDF1614839.1 type II toxin-antitoxin system RelE/ParE family toxin [Desulfurivibrio alkaliphilus]